MTETKSASDFGQKMVGAATHLKCVRGETDSPYRLTGRVSVKLPSKFKPPKPMPIAVFRRNLPEVVTISKFPKKYSL